MSRLANKLLAIFRVDATAAIGGGHIIRCLALADQLSKRKWRCVFLCHADTGDMRRIVSDHHRIKFLGAAELEVSALKSAYSGNADLVVVDHYGLHAQYEEALRSLARFVVAIDDVPIRRHEVNILVDQTVGRKSEAYRTLVPPDCAVLCGAQYALLRQEFADVRARSLARRRQSRRPMRLLVSFGLTDPENVTAKVIQAVSGIADFDHIDIVLGGAAPHLEDVQKAVRSFSARAHIHIDTQKMAELACNADVAVGAAGVSALERCSVGLPSVLIVCADNQLDNARGLAEMGAAINLGWHAAISASDLRETLRDLIAQEDVRHKLSQNATRICDGDGASRVADAIHGLYQ